jgi:formiminoglutamase
MTDSDCRSWFSAADLLTQDRTAPIALIGAPLGLGSITPGRCDLAPETVRAAMKRMSVYDVETEVDLSEMRVFDAGDMPIAQLQPSEARDPMVDRLAPLLEAHQLVIVLGGNNAVTRPCVHALRENHAAGVLTLDAHFDLRDTDCGLTNGNPIQALLEDGLPGKSIAQVGLLAFANTKKAHGKAKAAGIHVVTIAECVSGGFAEQCLQSLDKLSAECDTIHVDFDIDVIERAHMPGAPGARPGGCSPREFFQATRAICAHPLVRSVDLTEFDPSLDVANISALTAARWMCEVLAGFQRRDG